MEALTRMMRSSWAIGALVIPLIGWGIWSGMTAGDADAGAAVVSEEAAVDSGLDPDVASAIAHYENEVRYNRGNVETADNLFQLATLYYSGAENFEQASLYYEALVQEYPQYHDAATAYTNLVTCYERLGNDELRRSTLLRMTNEFEPDSGPYLFAKQELGL